MKNFSLSILSFCVLLMAGCRTAKSVQTTEERLAQKIGHSVYASVLDSISRAFVLSIDSVCLEFDPIPCADSTAGAVVHPSKAKAYGLRTKATTEEKSVTLAGAVVTEATEKQVAKTKQRTSQRAGPIGAVQWICIGAVFLLLLLLAKRLYR
mgnify:CR=1 FL=1